jgi:alpha-N-arabinofuranosidase
MIGLERNSDLVKMASYAPMMEHFGRTQWTPNLIGVDSTPGSLTGSVSYYVQLLFSSHRGSTILPVSSTSDFGPLYWVASSTTTGTCYVKLANYGNTTESVTVTVPGATSASATADLTVLTGPSTGSNYPNNVTITPSSSSVTGSASGGWTFSLPGYGVAVLTVTT